MKSMAAVPPILELEEGERLLEDPLAGVLAFAPARPSARTPHGSSATQRRASDSTAFD